MYLSLSNFSFEYLIYCLHDFNWLVVRNLIKILVLLVVDFQTLFFCSFKFSAFFCSVSFSVKMYLLVLLFIQFFFLFSFISVVQLSFQLNEL